MTSIINRLSRTAILLASLATAGIGGGCIAVAAGAGVGTAYALGEETMYSERDIESTITAVKQAFGDYGVTYTGLERKPDGAYIRGHKFIEDDTEHILVGVWDKGSKQPLKIEVRIGTIGKKQESLALMGHIQKRLDAQPAATGPA